MVDILVEAFTGVSVTGQLTFVDVSLPAFVAVPMQVALVRIVDAFVSICLIAFFRTKFLPMHINDDIMGYLSQKNVEGVLIDGDRHSVTEQGVIDFCFGSDGDVTRYRRLTILVDVLSDGFVRKCVDRYRSCFTDAPIALTIRVNVRPNLRLDGLAPCELLVIENERVFKVLVYHAQMQVCIRCFY
ncbi:hypothetical protein AAVH_21694 [Aphelenchoides avenae]|nr:hypothetical protein AAVH_21694 [Aphelenchus avenae]